MGKYFYIAIAYLIPLTTGAQGSGGDDGGFLNIWRGASCAPLGGGPTLPCSLCDFVVVGSNAITDLIKIGFFLAVIMIVWGGILMMTSAGNEGQFKTGKDRIVAALVGLAVALAAYLIVNEVFHLLTGNENVPWASVRC